MAKPPVISSKLERWPIDRLVPYERNARTHSPEQVAQIAASIQEFGFTNPILVASDDGILAGHGRLAAAKSLGLTEVPVLVLDPLTPTQRRAYVLADNKLALNAGWDEQLLGEELLELRTEGISWDLLGWSDDELAELLVSGNKQEEEDSEEEDDEQCDERGQPLAIVLQPEELREWREAKQQMGCSRDKAALMRLVDAYLNETRGAA
jgi:ParB-like chromosome segregation protein Spo0J